MAVLGGVHGNELLGINIQRSSSCISFIMLLVERKWESKPSAGQAKRCGGSAALGLRDVRQTGPQGLRVKEGVPLLF